MLKLLSCLFLDIFHFVHILYFIWNPDRNSVFNVRSDK